MSPAAFTVTSDGGGISWQVFLPGIYAAPVATLTVSTQEPVTVVVLPGCSDMVSSAGAVLKTWYAVGATVEEAHAFGWIAARDFGGMSFPVQPLPGESATVLRIWSKIDARSVSAGTPFRGGFELVVCGEEQMLDGGGDGEQSLQARPAVRGVYRGRTAP